MLYVRKYCNKSKCEILCRERQYLFIGSLSKLFSPICMHSVSDFIHSQSHIHIPQNIGTCVPKWSVQEHLHRGHRLLSPCYISDVLLTSNGEIL